MWTLINKTRPMCCVARLIGLLAVCQTVVVSACPAETRCSCKHSTVHCVDLMEIPGKIPDSTTSLTLEHGHISVIEAAKVGHLHELRSLQIIANNVSVVEEGAFASMTSLRELSLRANRLAALPVGVFAGLGALRQLTLSDNELGSLEGLLAGLGALEVLYVDNNRVGHVTAATFSGLPQLHHLKLQQNLLRAVPSPTFASNPGMMLLSLGSNPLGPAPPSIPLATNLQYLNLSDCGLTWFPAALPPSLQLLTLSNNNLTTISAYDMIPYTRLTALMLDGNQLTHIEAGAFQHMAQLREVFLFYNKLGTVPGPLPPSITALHLDNNNITTIPQQAFTPGTHIKLLSLRTNLIANIDHTAFKNIESIEKLDLETNPIHSLQDNMFVHAKGLQTLSLSMLHLKNIETDCFRGLDSLRELKMSHVQVESIEGNFLAHLPKLEILDVAHSPALAQFVLYNGEVLGSVAGLREINLAAARLTSLTSSLPTLLPHLDRINLAANPLRCNSALLWLRAWQHLEPHKFAEFGQVRCDTPLQLQGERVGDLQLWQFDCDRPIPDSRCNSSDHYTDPAGHTTPSYTNIYGDNYADPYDDYNITQYYDEYKEYKDLYDSLFGHKEQKDSTNTTTTTTTPPQNTSLEPTDVPMSTVPAPTPTTTGAPSSAAQDSSLREAGIIIGMAMAVIVTMLLVAAVLYICCSYRRSTVVLNEYQEKEDYVFIVTKPETGEPDAAESTLARRTREERGSTTSHASEDIANHTDLDMKVYTLDMDA